MALAGAIADKPQIYEAKTRRSAGHSRFLTPSTAYPDAF